MTGIPGLIFIVWMSKKITLALTWVGIICWYSIPLLGISLCVHMCIWRLFYLLCTTWWIAVIIQYIQGDSKLYQQNYRVNSWHENELVYLDSLCIKFVSRVLITQFTLVICKLVFTLVLTTLKMSSTWINSTEQCIAVLC